MVKRLVVLSGPVCAGKTSLAKELERRFGARIIKSRHLLMSEVGASNDRAELQTAGETLDRSTGGAWLAKAVEQEVEALPDDVEVLVDSVRTADQVEALRSKFGMRVAHVHLSAPERDLETRYQERKRTNADDRELESYAAVRRNATEAAVESLRNIADIVIETERCEPDDVWVRVACHLGYFSSSSRKLVDVMVGGQWGSEGKGHLASYLAPEYQVLVRVAGPNAGHKVYLGDATTFTFRSLPSGTLHNPSAALVIAPGSTVFVPDLLEEIARCEVHVDRLTVDPQVMVIEEFDRKFEKQLRKDIGSTA